MELHELRPLMKRRLEILEARNVLKQRLESLIDEEKWLLEVAELNERGFAAPSVDSVPAGVLPQQLLQSTMEAGATVAATATSATEQLAKAQQISALLMDDSSSSSSSEEEEDDNNKRRIEEM